MLWKQFFPAPFRTEIDFEKSAGSQNLFESVQKNNMSADGQIVCVRIVNCLKQLTQGTAFQLCWLMSHDGISQTSDTHKIDRKRGEEVAILQRITCALTKACGLGLVPTSLIVAVCLSTFRQNSGASGYVKYLSQDQSHKEFQHCFSRCKSFCLHCESSAIGQSDHLLWNHFCRIIACCICRTVPTTRPGCEYFGPIPNSTNDKAFVPYQHAQ